VYDIILLLASFLDVSVWQEAFSKLNEDVASQLRLASFVVPSR
jgi:hypothetical protein